MPVANKTTQPSPTDNEMIRRIEASHSAEVRWFSPQPVLDVVENILHRTSTSTATALPGNIDHQLRTYAAELDAKEKKALREGFHKKMYLVSDKINKLSTEMFCMCSGGGGDINAKIWAMLDPVSTFSWGAKLVIALAAFAGNYGQLGLLSQLYNHNPLAKSVTLIKYHPREIDALTPKFKEIITNVLTATMGVTKSILEFEELSSHYIIPGAEEITTATAQFPAAVYWTIRSLVACASLITKIVGSAGSKERVSETQLSELSSLVSMVNYYRELLNKQLSLTYSHINGQREMETYERVVKTMEAPVCGDIMKIIRALIFSKNDQLPLFDGVTKERARLDVLSRKNVILLVSDLRLEIDTISMQRLIDSRQLLGSRYEILWFPVVEQMDEDKEIEFKEYQSQMPWYSIYHPSLVEPGVIRFIKEVWHFNQEPLLLVFDPQGNLLNQNALHMLRIWGTSAIPFTSAREAQLWNNESWRMELLLDDIHPPASSWMQEQKYICLFGGNDNDWISSFTAAAKEVARTAKIPLEMLYVDGNKNFAESYGATTSTFFIHRRLSDILGVRRLSDVLEVPIYFWLRLDSMWRSMTKHNRAEEHNPVMSGVMAMKHFDRNEQGWAVIGQSSSQLAMGKGDLMLKSLSEYEQWSQKAEEQGFVPALMDYLQQLHTPDHCIRIILQDTAEGFPRKIVCPQCERRMEKFMMYRCCYD